MTVTEKNFLIVMKQICHPDLDIKLLDPVDIIELIKLADSHNVLPLVYEYLKDKKYVSVVDPTYNQVKMSSLKTIIYQTKKTEAFLNLYQQFNEANLHPIVLKGLICRTLYGKYENLRASGDEDILINVSDFMKYKEILEANNFICDRENVTEKQLKVVQEVSFKNENNNLKLELHINPVGKDNAIYAKMNSYFDNYNENYIDMEFASKTHGIIMVRTLSPTYHLLFLIFHLYKHMTVSGFGLRQVMDVLLFTEKYYNDIDFDFLNKALKETSTYGLFSDILHLGNEYLDFSFETSVAAIAINDLLNDIFQNGAFGNVTQAQKTALSMTKASIGKDQSKAGKIATLWKTLFPPKDTLIIDHPELADKPVLLLKYWVVRWINFLKHSKNHDSNLMKESMEISKRKIDLANKYKKDM